MGDPVSNQLAYNRSKREQSEMSSEDPKPENERAESRWAPDGRNLSDFDRRLLYKRGFGDGAKGSAIKRADYPDYMNGWNDGAKASGEACRAYFDQHELGQPSILRAQS